MPIVDRRLARVLAIPSLMVLVAACSSLGGGGAAASAPSPSSAPSAASAPSAGGGGGAADYGKGGGSSPSTAPATQPSAAGAVEVGTGTGTAGTYLTGTGGLTVYTFSKDSPNASVCVDACATNWPPLTVPAGASPTAGAGVTGALTTFARADGTLQVAYGGKPLYYFAADKAAGDTNGQGVGGVWFIAQP